MTKSHLRASAQKLIEDGWKNDDEAHELLALIVAEFESDPLSVQCFDSRIVDRAKLCVARRKKYNEKGPIF